MRLEVSNLTAGYQGIPVVHSVDLSFEGGRITGIIGPNGAGKSTLLKSLFGGAQLLNGSVTIDGERLPRVAPRQLLARGVAYVPQLRNVFPSLTVLENLEMGTIGDRSIPIDEVVAVFPELRSLLKRQAGRLSGGERNLVAVARGLVSNPSLLLIDEGSAGLAPQLVSSYWQHLTDLVARDVGVVVVEQNVSLVLEHAHDMYLLAGGRVRLKCTAGEMARRDDLGALFLGAGHDAAPTSSGSPGLGAA